jgi:hypothetical protein
MTQIAGNQVNIIDLMANLAEKRPAFHSEADFQHAFAWSICEGDPRLTARLEIPVTAHERIDLLPDSRGHIDLLLIDTETGAQTAIEFKYPTAAWAETVRGESFRLKAHGATDLSSYDALKDLRRLESLVDAGSVQNGLLIMLTNEPAYWNGPASSKSTNADAFRIHDGVTISGSRAWSPKTGGGTKQGRASAIELRGEYSIAWQDFSELLGNKGRFRWFSLEVHGQD